MSELATATRETLAALAASDRGLRRFGARTHRYELAPPLPADQVAALPDDLRELASTVGAGGAGPYYGWLPLARVLDRPTTAPRGVSTWQRALPIAHLGCGYAAVLPLDGDARGEIWLDARSVGLVRPIAPSFTAFYLDWIDRLAHAAWPEGYVPDGVCPLPNALGGYLAHCEAELGVEPGRLSGPALRDALVRLGPGSIVIAAGASALFLDDDPVDPCIVCARLVDQLAADGLARDVIAPGVEPLPIRPEPADLS
ncbi:MAG TPA: hypothetical protein VFQ53_43710 [Kofleriaceae bacterium]|nr:hypothetical protein [Kofleriaceae bacterium]